MQSNQQWKLRVLFTMHRVNINMTTRTCETINVCVTVKVNTDWPWNAPVHDTSAYSYNTQVAEALTDRRGLLCVCLW